MQYFLYLLAIPFLYLNYKIIKSDLKIKKIPNKYLLYLLAIIPFYYIYIFFSFTDLNYLAFFWQIFFALLISFILYSFWIWSAWDAKYLLVLSLFIPNIWIIPFIWNLWIITLTYLLMYFIRFYIWKCLFKKWFAKDMYQKTKIELSDRWWIYKNKKWWKSINVVLKFLLIFLLIFVIIRLSRLYIIKNLTKSTIYNIDSVQLFVEQYHFYLIFAWIIFFIWTIFLFRLVYGKVFWYIKHKLLGYWMSDNKIENIFLILITSALLIFIGLELLINKQEILSFLYKIFTYYIIIYLIFKFLYYSYKITFSYGETYYTNIQNLQKWDIIDKEYLIKIFWENAILWANSEKQNKEWIFYPDPRKAILDLDNPIDELWVEKLQKAYRDVTDELEKNNLKKDATVDIKLLKTFAFWIYIFFALVITFIFWNQIIVFLINFLLEQIQNIFN